MSIPVTFIGESPGRKACEAHALPSQHTQPTQDIGDMRACMW